MIVREAYRNRSVRVCRAHYDGVFVAPDMPFLGPVEAAHSPEPCEFCAAMEARIVAMKAEGRSFREIARDLAREGHARAGGRPHYPYQVQRIYDRAVGLGFYGETAT